MRIFSVLVLLVVMGIRASDPGHCQRVIKYMLIKACGETKRESQLDDLLPVMSDLEIENRYKQMVKGNMVRGLRAEEAYEFEITNNQLETNEIYENKASTNDPLFYEAPKRLRFRRSMIGGVVGKSHARHITDPHTHDKVGSMKFIDSMLPKIDAPVPPSLKVQCCAPRICSMDHFKTFCEVD